MKAGDNTQEEQDIRVGYQVAMNINLHEEQQMWSRSNAMLVANGLIVASLGLSLEKHVKLFSMGPLFNKIGIYRIPLLFVMSFAGLVLCYVWFCLIARTIIKATIWVQEASRLETRLHKTVRTIKAGHVWTCGDKKKDISGCKYREIMERGGEKKRKFHCIKMGWLERWLSNKRKVKDAPYMIAIIFMIIYLCTLFVGIGEFGLKETEDASKETVKEISSVIERYEEQLDAVEKRISNLEKVRRIPTVK